MKEGWWRIFWYKENVSTKIEVFFHQIISYTHLCTHVLLSLCNLSMTYWSRSEPSFHPWDSLISSICAFPSIREVRPNCWTMIVFPYAIFQIDVSVTSSWLSPRMQYSKSLDNVRPSAPGRAQPAQQVLGRNARTYGLLPLTATPRTPSSRPVGPWRRQSPRKHGVVTTACGSRSPTVRAPADRLWSWPSDERSAGHRGRGRGGCAAVVVAARRLAVPAPLSEVWIRLLLQHQCRRAGAEDIVSQCCPILPQGSMSTALDRCRTADQKILALVLPLHQRALPYIFCVAIQQGDP